MAHPSVQLIAALRSAASQLSSGAPYAWGHHGSCNCGHLLQVITHCSREEILRHAQTIHGEWSEIAESYCGVTNTPAYLMMSKLEAFGLTPTDINNLEYLKDREVLKQLPGGFRWLRKNEREDVILYFNTMAGILEKKLKPAKETPGKALPTLRVEETVLA